MKIELLLGTPFFSHRQSVHMEIKNESSVKMDRDLTYEELLHMVTGYERSQVYMYHLFSLDS